MYTAAHGALLNQLDSAGVVVLKSHHRFSGVVPTALDAHLEALWAAGEGEDDAATGDASQPLGEASGGTRRLSNLMAKDDAKRTLAALASDPVVVQMCGHVVGGVERLELSSLTARSTPGMLEPGRGHGAAAPRESLRSESDAVADDDGSWVCAALWIVTNYTLRSGPLRVVPGSHARRERAGDALADAAAEHPDEVLVEGVAGDVVVYNGHVWYAETPNGSSERRTAIRALYTRRGVPQQQQQGALLADAGSAVQAGQCAAGQGGCAGSGGASAGSAGAEVELRWPLDIEAEL